MLWVPSKTGTKIIHNMGTVGAFPGTTVTANATTLLDGAIVECISAANNVQDSWGIFVGVCAQAGPSGLATQGMVDILIGGVTDDVLIASLLCGPNPRALSSGWMFPLHIPGGLRIAARTANVVVSKVMSVVIMLYGGSPPPWRCGRKVTTIGTQINNARGQAIVPGASGGAATATELIASTAEPYFAFIPSFQVATDTTVATQQMNVGIGVGAATEERIGTWMFAGTTNEEWLGPFPQMYVEREIPAGTRLTMLAGCSSALDTYDGLIHAVS